VEFETYDDFEKVFEGTSLKHRFIKADDEEPWELV
jgi:hypothetical protein